jgi:hypothetical protein
MQDEFAILTLILYDVMTCSYSNKLKKAINVLITLSLFSWTKHKYVLYIFCLRQCKITCKLTNYQSFTT